MMRTSNKGVLAKRLAKTNSKIHHELRKWHGLNVLKEELYDEILFEKSSMKPVRGVQYCQVSASLKVQL